MMWRLGAAVLLLLGFLQVATHADTDVDSGNSAFTVGAHKHAKAGEREGGTVRADGPAPVYHERESCDRYSSLLCYRQVSCEDGAPEMYYWLTDPVTSEPLGSGTYCPSESNPAAPRITGRMVSAAFRRIPLPASELTIQPPGGKTLVNFDTNFFTDSATTLDRTVRLLGRRVDLRITAATYTWHFGAGVIRSTSGPGAPYPALKVTHNYLQTGRYRPSLDTTYAADFRINGGPWRPVDGTVTITGTPQQLRAIEARPVLVNYENQRHPRQN